MQSVHLVVEHTDETIHPMHAFVCASDAVERELLLQGRTDDDVRTLLFYVEGDADAYESTLAAQEAVIEYDVRPDADGGFFCYVRVPNRAAESSLLAAFERETVVVVPPTEFRSDRTMHLRLVGHGDELQGVLDALPDALGVDVRSVGSYDRAMTPSVTDRQREALSVARAAGYFAVPREAGIETVADELDCSVSAASTLLRRAQRTLVADALE